MSSRPTRIYGHRCTMIIIDDPADQARVMKEGETMVTRTTNDESANFEVVTAEDAVEKYLTTNNLTEETIPLEAVLVQTKGTASGRPDILLVATVDGKKVAIKATARLLSAASTQLDGVIEQRLGRYWKDG